MDYTTLLDPCQIASMTCAARFLRQMRPTYLGSAEELGTNRPRSPSDGRQTGHQRNPLDSRLRSQLTGTRGDGDRGPARIRRPSSRGYPGLLTLRHQVLAGDGISAPGSRGCLTCFLVNECTGPAVARWLRKQGPEVISVYEEARGAEDGWIIQKAFPEGIR